MPNLALPSLAVEQPVAVESMLLLVLVQLNSGDEPVVLLLRNRLNDHKRFGFFCFVKSNKHKSFVLVGKVIVIGEVFQLMD